MTGVLYGVGVGPGDPELMTLKAHRLIASADVIAYPVLERGESFARSIAAGAISSNTQEIAIIVPMSVERAPAQAAYDSGAAKIANALDEGKTVVVLCEGDPFFYGSFMYIHSRLRDQYECRVVPGVTSVSACAAQIARPLSARNEVLTIIPGPMDAAEMQSRIEGAEAVAIMKVGRHLPKIKRILDQLDLSRHATYIERATLDTQRIVALRDVIEPAPYFSMILISKGNDPWL